MKLEFDWDQWIIQKNEHKHGVSRLEAESVFYDHNFIIFKDEKHSTKSEVRWISFGSSILKRVLIIAFTIRNKKVRIISSRQASKKERIIYEKEKANRNN